MPNYTGSTNFYGQGGTVDFGTTNQDVWSAWNVNVKITTTSTTVTSGTIPINNNIWAIWNNCWWGANGLPCACRSCEANWPNSAFGAIGSITFNSNTVWANWNTPIQETEDQKKARIESERVAAIAWKKRERMIKAANRLARIKARRILLEHLNAKQRKDFLEKKFFKLYVEDRVYKIEYGRARNIKLIREEGDLDKVLQTYCVHPIAEVPDEDTMLVQKLMLETTEKEFLKIANVTNGYLPLMRGSMAA